MRALRNAGRSDVEIGLFRASGPDRFRARLGSDEQKRARDLFADRFVLLIHGWNVRVEDQAKSYDRLLALLEDRHPALAKAVLTVSWPGKGGYLSALENAAMTAEALRELLCDPARPFARSREIMLIGHSMGCRVALELAALLLREPVFTPHLRLHLMAAAVPVPLVGAGGRLRSAAIGCEHRAVYYSATDQTFMAPFQFIESWADSGQRLWPDAVGRHGRPVDVWRRRVSVTPCFHGGYWKSKRVAGEILADFAHRQVRPLPVRM